MFSNISRVYIAKAAYLGTILNADKFIPRTFQFESLEDTLPIEFPSVS